MHLVRFPRLLGVVNAQSKSLFALDTRVDVRVLDLNLSNDDSGKPSDSSNIPTEEKDILGSIAEEYDLDERSDEEVNPKLAGVCQ